MIKNVASACGKVKDRIKKLIEEANGVKKEIETFKSTLETIQKDIASGDLIANGKKCKDADKKTQKAAFEFIYGEIKAEEKKADAGGDDEGGFCKGQKCSIF
jgi:hypothetical protein